MPLDVGQRLWRSRYGDRTSIRVAPAAGQSLADARDRYADRLRARHRSAGGGPVRARRARRRPGRVARGRPTSASTSPISASSSSSRRCCSPALFFRLGVEQRAREVGLLRAVGYTTARIRRLFGAEGLVAGRARQRDRDCGRASATRRSMMAGLRLVVERRGRHQRAPAPRVAGVARGRRRRRDRHGAGVRLVDAARAVARLGAQPARRACCRATSSRAPAAPARRERRSSRRRASALSGSRSSRASAARAIDETGAFFGAGSALLVACLCLVAFALRRPRAPVRSRAADGGPLCGWDCATPRDRPGRSVLVGRRDRGGDVHPDLGRRISRVPRPPPGDRRSGVGGYAVLVAVAACRWRTIPTAATAAKRWASRRSRTRGVEPFRVRPGDDASCLNLYEPTTPTHPRRPAAPSSTSGRFAFQGSLAPSDAERANPWLLLDRAAAEPARRSRSFPSSPTRTR